VLSFPLPAIDPSWTLFLDRDGVLNRRIEGDYVRTVARLEILPGVPEAVAKLAQRFRHVLVVTNQRGVARGLIHPAELDRIHARLKQVLRVDAIYVCPHEAGICDCRKPKIGLALQAKRDYPDIDLRRALMIGDSESDMAFARGADMHGVLVAGDTGLAEIAARLAPAL